MTTKSTISVSGGAVPKFDHKAIMVRAWVIFRNTYKYPQISFASIGRKCFGWALQRAWAEAREARRLASVPAAEKSARIAGLMRTIELASYSESWPQASQEIKEARDEMQRLSA